MIPRRDIVEVQFSILSPEEIKNMATTVVNKTDGIENGIHKKESAYDMKLGVITNNVECLTCKLGSNEDPGHFGYIDLAKPVFNPEFIKYKYIINILKCLCFKCGHLLIPQEMYPKILNYVPARARLKYCENVIRKTKKVKKCLNCGFDKFPDYQIYSGYRLQYKFTQKGIDTGKKGKYMEMYPENVLALFKVLKDIEIEVLGLSPVHSRPEWMIMRYLPVPPPSIRPVVLNNEANKSEDNLFKFITNIIKTNNTLKEKLSKIDSSELINKNEYAVKGVSENFMLLVYHITAMMNDIINKRSGGGGITYNKTNKPLKSIEEMLKGKEGFIRGNLMGKRVEFTARTVISPDGQIDIDEIGIPLQVANQLNYPERVTPYNIERLRRAIINGNEVYPGAYILMQMKTNSKILLVKMNKSVKEELAKNLEVGDIVRRHLINGDRVLLNRQPTLHKYGYMSAKIKVIPNNNTFRINTCCTSPYNADFDGDEMTIKVLQSIPTVNESLQLMSIRKHFISAGFSSTIISLIQDNVLGAYLMTKYGSYEIDKSTYMHLLAVAEYFDISSIPQGKTTFKLIECIEALLPKDFSIDEKGIKIVNGKFVLKQVPVEPKLKKKKKLDPYETVPKKHTRDIALQEKILQDDMYITDETLRSLAGENKEQYNILTKSNIQHTLVKTLFNYYGPDVTNNFVTALQRMTNRFLMLFGSTCSINDIIIPDNLKEELKNNIKQAHIDVFKLLDDFDTERIIIPLTKTPSDYYETMVRDRMNPYLQKNEKLVEEYIKSRPWNNLYNMVNSKAKGTQLNIRQIIDNVGQQTVASKRIEKSYGDRTLPHYPRFTESPESRGFVSNSFFDGLTAKELFMHSSGARMGLMDTSLKTSVSGYISRKMIQFMEDITVHYDGLIRRSDDRIITFAHGSHGLDTTWITENKIDFHNINDATFMELYI